MQRRHRLIALFVLTAALLGLAVHYGATYDENWPHPSGEQLADDPAGWDGERVLLFGTAVDRTDSGLTVTVTDDAGEVARTVAVRGTDASVERGGVVQVYGELDEEGTVQHAERVVVVNEQPGDERYKLGTSALGVVFAAGLFLWRWRIELRELRFRRREAGEPDG